jgi:hypothetical protein
MRTPDLLIALVIAALPASTLALEGLDNGPGKPCLIKGKSCDARLQAAHLTRNKELEEEAQLTIQIDLVESALEGKESISPPHVVDQVKRLGPTTLKKLWKNLHYQTVKRLQARGAQSHTHCLHPEKFMTGAVVVGQMLIAEQGDAVFEQAAAAIKSHANDAPANWTPRYTVDADLLYCKFSEAQIEQMRLNDFARRQGLKGYLEGLRTLTAEARLPLHYVGYLVHANGQDDYVVTQSFGNKVLASSSEDETPVVIDFGTEAPLSEGTSLDDLYLQLVRNGPYTTVTGVPRNAFFFKVKKAPVFKN